MTRTDVQRDAMALSLASPTTSPATAKPPRPPGPGHPIPSSPAPQRGDTPLQPEQFLDMLTKPEDLVGMLAKPGEFISSAYDFAEQLLTAQRKFAEGMVQATKPLLSGTQDATPEKDDAR